MSPRRPRWQQRDGATDFTSQPLLSAISRAGYSLQSLDESLSSFVLLSCPRFTPSAQARCKQNCSLVAAVGFALGGAERRVHESRHVGEPCWQLIPLVKLDPTAQWVGPLCTLAAHLVLHLQVLTRGTGESWGDKNLQRRNGFVNPY